MRILYGFKFFKFRVIRDNDVAFKKLVARECYNLTHELVTNKLAEGFMDSRYRHTNPAWMELDRAMAEFADTY